jgi:outer membrane receptor protein involved in Fe transport
MPPPNRSIRRHPQSALAAAVALAISAPAAHAEDPSGDALEPIVVTANRREQNALDVPYNISTVSGAAMENAGVTNLVDLARLLPGVTIPDLGARANSSNSLITIRGLNVSDPVASAYLPWGSVPTVSTYVDDVPLYVNFKLDDIQRVEVLRGPQGTLYGSGAVGGTIKMQHNAPNLAQFSAEASAEGSKTSHSGGPSYGAHFVINMPVTDKLGLRVSAGHEQQAGFIDATNATVFGPNQQPILANPANPLTSGLVQIPLTHVDDSHMSNARAALLWKIAPGFEANLAYQTQNDYSGGFAHETLGLKYRNAALLPQEPESRKVGLESLALSMDAGFATITSSTSFSTKKVDNAYDQSQFVEFYASLTPLLYGNYPRITSPFFTHSRDNSFTEELRLGSKEGGAWDYTAGAFFQRQTQNLFQYETAPGFGAWSELPGSAAAVNSTLGSNYANYGDFIQMYNGGTRPSATSPTDTNFTYLRLSDFTDRAIFGELTRHITQRWQVTGGARVFWQRFNQSLYSTLPYGGPFYSTLPPPANATDSLGSTIVDRGQSYHNHIFKLNTSYAISPAMHAYGTYSEGFRHGGINALPVGKCIFCESADLVPYKSDTVKNYELGIKGVANGWVRYSAAAYRINWQDVQIQGFSQANWPVVINGKDARSQGIELELGGRLGGGWAGNLGYGFTDARLTQDFTVNDPIPNSASIFTVVAGKTGDRLPYVSRQTLTANVDYTHTLTDRTGVDAHLSAAYHSDVRTQINPNVLGYRILPGFTTLNGSVGLSLGDQWHARLFVTNITNVLGITSAGPLLRLYDDPRYRVESVTQPRTVGLGIDYHFD